MCFFLLFAILKKKNPSSLIELIVWLIGRFWVENYFPLKFWGHGFVVFLLPVWLMRSPLPVWFSDLSPSYCCSEVSFGQELAFHHVEHLWALSGWGLRNFTLVQPLVLFLWKCLPLVVLIYFSRNKILVCRSFSIFSFSYFSFHSKVLFYWSIIYIWQKSLLLMYSSINFGKCIQWYNHYHNQGTGSTLTKRWKQPMCPLMDE